MHQKSFCELVRRIFRMNDNTEKSNTEAKDEILGQRRPYLDKYYAQVRYAYQNSYEWPNLDPVRHEAALCIMLGLFQSGITITNHLLESLLKLSVVIASSKGNQPSSEEEIDGRVVDSLIESYQDGLNQFGSSTLHDTINAAHKLGLVADEEKDQLHRIREDFRNAYGHADKSKTFGGQSVSVQAVRLRNDRLELDQKADRPVAALLIGQGIAQARQAEAQGPDYFLYVDRLARNIREKLFGPIEDPFNNLSAS